MPIITITQPETFKLGSTWRFVVTRKNSDGSPIDLSGLAARAMFREESEDGPVKATLTDGDGIVVDAGAGRVMLTVDAQTSATFAPKAWVYFDVELAASATDTWQSFTYRFKTQQQVTR